MTLFSGIFQEKSLKAAMDNQKQSDIWSIITKRGKGYNKTGQLSGFWQDCFNETFSRNFQDKNLKVAIYNQKQSDIWSFITKRGKGYNKTGQLLRKDTYLQCAYYNQTFLITKRGSYQEKIVIYRVITKRGKGCYKTGKLFESVRHLEFYHKTGQGL